MPHDRRPDEAPAPAAGDAPAARGREGEPPASEGLAGARRLAGGVAHELNNELTRILAGAEALAGALAGDRELLPVVEDVRAAALRSARLTGGLVAFARGAGERAAAPDAGPTPGDAGDGRGTRPDAATEPARALRVLVVDDEPNVRISLSALLRAHGHAAVECSGGREALARYAVEWRAIDVVVLDERMPDLQGEEVLARLREVNPQVAVVVSSGLAGPAGRAAPGGRIRFLQKPFTAGELAAALAAAIGAPAA